MKKPLIILTFLAVGISHFANAGSSDQAAKIFKLVTTNAENKFCAKGFGFIVETIGSYEGQACSQPLNAALALDVWEGVGDFDSSHCYKKALESLKKSFPCRRSTPQSGDNRCCERSGRRM